MIKVTSLEQFVRLLADNLVALYITIEGKNYPLDRVRAYGMTFLHTIELINNQQLYFI